MAERDSDLTITLVNVGPGTCSHVVFKLGLPPAELLHLRGNDRIEVARLLEGESSSRSITVRPRKVGACTVRSTNFSYRDGGGNSIRVPDFRAELQVSGSAQTIARRVRTLELEVLDGEFVHGEWDRLRLRVGNDTGARVGALRLTMRDNANFVVRSSTQFIESLAPEERNELSFYIRPTEAGPRVPISISTNYKDTSGREHTQRDEFLLAVKAPRTHSTKVVYKMGDEYKIAQNVGAVGRGATVNADNLSFNSAQHNAPLDLGKLADDLAKLRAALRGLDSPRADSALGAVADAEAAARAGDSRKVMVNLKRAGKWVLELAQQVGAQTAVAAINSSLGQ